MKNTMVYLDLDELDQMAGGQVGEPNYGLIHLHLTQRNGNWVDEMQKECPGSSMNRSVRECRKGYMVRQYRRVVGGDLPK